MTRLPLLVLLVATAAQATLPARDNFHRTDLGGNWSQSNVPAGDCALCSNALTSNVSGSDGLCFWDADAFQGTQYACGRLGGTAMGFAGACVDMDPNSAVCCSTMGNHGWEMDAYLFHTAIGPVNAASSPVFAVGDYIGIQQNSATTFRCYRSTDGTTWTSLGGSDTTVIGGPFPGASGALSNGQGFTLTQWEGGNGILPSSTPCGSMPLPTTTTTTSTTTTSTTTTSTTSTTTPSSPTTSTTSSSTTSSSTLSTTTTTTSTTTSTTVPAPPLAPSSVIGSASTCTSCAFTWTNATDPFLSQTCIGPSGCSDMSTLSCVLAPATSTTHSQNAGTVVGYFGCSIDTFGQMSTNIGPVFVTTPTCASTSTTTTTTLVPSSLCGDVNNNGRVDIGDALQIGLFANGVVKCSQALAIPGNCDVNHDNHCTIADATAIQACLIAHNCNTLTCGHFRCPNKDATLAERDNNLGTIWYRGDRLRVGPADFLDLEAYGSGPGTWVWCDDCFPTNPATGPGGPGAHCFHDANQWNCSAGTIPPTPCGQSCPPNALLTGLNTDCTPICETCNLNCQNGGVCVFSANGPACICDPHFCGALCQQMCSPTTTTAAPTTTTSSTTVTTSTTLSGTTSTSTSSTTSTTLAVQNSTTHIVVPFYPTNEVIQTFDNAHNTVPVCVRFQNPIGIASATSSAIYMGRACGIGEHMFWGIYPDSDGGTVIASAGAICGGADNQVLRQTGLPGFSLTRGTMYRACACVTNTVFFGTNASYAAAKWIPNTGFAAEQNIFVPSVGYAANVCTGSALPTTTGAITPDNTLRAPLILISTE